MSTINTILASFYNRQHYFGVVFSINLILFRFKDKPIRRFCPSWLVFCPGHQNFFLRAHLKFYSVHHTHDHDILFISFYIPWSLKSSVLFTMSVISCPCCVTWSQYTQCTGWPRDEDTAHGEVAEALWLHCHRWVMSRTGAPHTIPCTTCILYIYNIINARCG